MEKSLVSIITPVYNRPELLRKAIQSALMQTYNNFEYIIVDDASTEDVRSVVESFNDPRIKYYRNSKNMMMAATYNRGIAEAKGDYVAFLESDDQWLLTKLEKQLKKFEGSPSAGVIYTGRFLIDPNEKILSEDWPQFRGNIFKTCLERPLLAPTVLMVKKELGDKIGWFDSVLPGWNDWDLIIRLSKIAEFDFVNELLVNFLIHPHQLTSEFDKNLQKTVDFYNLIYNKHKQDYKSNPDISNNILRTIGGLYCRLGQNSIGRKYFKTAIKIKPLSFKNYRSFLLSFLNKKIFSFLYSISLKLREK